MEAILWGRDHPELGPVAVETAGSRFAVGLTRGLHPKAYGHIDPNEDVAVALVGPRASLLAVADAHNGVEASEIAVQFLLDRFAGDPPPADLSDRELVRLFWEAGEAILAVTEELPRPRRESRTTLTLALVAGCRVQWAGMGDSPLVLVGPGPATVTELTVDRAAYVGWPLGPLEVAGRLSRGVADLEPGQWIALLTDGFTNFASVRDLAELLPGAEPAAAARTVLEHAGSRGAGDNIAVVLAGPCKET